MADSYRALVIDSVDCAFDWPEVTFQFRTGLSILVATSLPPRGSCTANNDTTDSRKGSCRRASMIAFFNYRV